MILRVGDDEEKIMAESLLNGRSIFDDVTAAADSAQTLNDNQTWVIWRLFPSEKLPQNSGEI